MPYLGILKKRTSESNLSSSAGEEEPKSGEIVRELGIVKNNAAGVVL
jgi:hypothetical protein